MGIVPPPHMLSNEEFIKRSKRLLDEDKILTMRSINPEFASWFERSKPGYPISWLLSKIFRIDLISDKRMDEPFPNQKSGQTSIGTCT